MKQVVRAALLIGALFVTPVATGVQTATAELSYPGGPTTAFEVGGQVTQQIIFNTAKLKQLAVATVNVTFFAAGAVTSHSYTGALLWDVLQKAGIAVDANVKNDILRKIVNVVGSDGYISAFGAGEVDPFFGGDQIIIAYAVDGQPLSSADGFAKLIAPGDKAGGRFVSNITKIIVRDGSW